MVRSPSVDKNGLRKGAWSEEEDDKLRAYVQRYGHWNWQQLPRFAGLARCGKSCRLRWMNYLRPGLKKGRYSKEEEELIIKLHEELGNKWSAIAAKLPGRTDNEVKNYWNSHLKKRIKQDPKSTEKTNGKSQNMHVMDQKEEDSSISLVSTDQEMEWEATVAAADPSTRENSSSNHNYSIRLGGEENSFTSEESFPKFFEDFWTEPFIPGTSDSQISSSTSCNSIALSLEDWVGENGISLEESFVKSFESFSTEPGFSNASDGLISPSTSCNSIVTNSAASSANAFYSFGAEPIFSNASNGHISPSTSCNSKVSNLDEAYADAFGGFWTQPVSLDTPHNQSIYQLPPVEEEPMLPFTIEVDQFNKF